MTARSRSARSHPGKPSKHDAEAYEVRQIQGDHPLIARLIEDHHLRSVLRPAYERLVKRQVAEYKKRLQGTTDDLEIEARAAAEREDLLVRFDVHVERWVRHLLQTIPDDKDVGMLERVIVSAVRREHSFLRHVDGAFGVSVAAELSVERRSKVKLDELEEEEKKEIVDELRGSSDRAISYIRGSLAEKGFKSLARAVAVPLAALLTPSKAKAVGSLLGGTAATRSALIATLVGVVGVAAGVVAINMCTGPSESGVAGLDTALPGQAATGPLSTAVATQAVPESQLLDVNSAGSTEVLSAEEPPAAGAVDGGAQLTGNVGLSLPDDALPTNVQLGGANERGSSSGSCPEGLPADVQCDLVLPFDESTEWVKKSGSALSSAPRVSTLTVASSFKARARIAGGVLEVKKKAIGDAPLGNVGVGVFWSQLGTAPKYARISCPVGEAVECVGAEAVQCTGSWQIVTSRSTDRNWGCGCGKMSATTRFDWVAVGSRRNSSKADGSSAMPHLLQPSSGARFREGEDVVLSWKPASGANRYRIRVCMDSNLRDCLTCPGSSSGTCELPVGQLKTLVTTAFDLKPATYYWQVQALLVYDGVDESSWGPGSEVWTFAILQPPTTCADECVPGYRDCLTATAVRTCGTHFDDDDCWEIGPPQRCAVGLTCVDGQCVDPQYVPNGRR